MTLKEIKEVMQDFNGSAIHILKIETEGCKLTLEKAPPAPVTVAPMAMPAPAVAPIAAPTSAAAAMAAPIAATAASTIAGTPIVAPLVGVYYKAASPGAKPFVNVGDKIKVGDVVCLIEAMKMINEIKSPISGTVKSILATDSSLVSFNETLMEIEE